MHSRSRGNRWSCGCVVGRCGRAGAVMRTGQVFLRDGVLSTCRLADLLTWSEQIYCVLRRVYNPDAGSCAACSVCSARARVCVCVCVCMCLASCGTQKCDVFAGRFFRVTTESAARLHVGRGLPGSGLGPGAACLPLRAQANPLAEGQSRSCPENDILFAPKSKIRSSSSPSPRHSGIFYCRCTK